MQGIYIAAIITTIISLGIIGGFLLWRTPRKERLIGIFIILMEIPMCACAFYFIRLPLDNLVTRFIPTSSTLYQIITTFYAPITEEPIKIWILLIPWIFKKFNQKNAILFAITIGLGFGIGELWMLAYQFAKYPNIASLPWYSLGGYIQERFIVCVMHGAFTAAALSLLRKKVFILGLLFGIFLHYLGNFPIYLASINLGGISAETWKLIVSIWLQFYFLAMLGFLALLLIKKSKY